MHKNPFESEFSLYGREQDVQRDCFPHSHYSSPVFWDRQDSGAFYLLSDFCVHEEDGCLYQDGWGQTAAITADTDHACAWIPDSKSISF